MGLHGIDKVWQLVIGLYLLRFVVLLLLLGLSQRLGSHSGDRRVVSSFVMLFCHSFWVSTQSTDEL